MPHPLPRCRVVPLPEFQFAFEIEGREVTRWCFPPNVPRPYFYPVTSPSGACLTRMGHPGAPNHDHHRSFWFAHNDVIGQDFWAEGKPPRIAQTQWYAIEDTDEFARLAFELIWTDGHDPRPLLKQDVFATVRPLDNHQWTLELQNDFRSSGEGIAFRKSNFGIMGLRVAKSLSVVFGGGHITGADGATGEAKLFGNANRWVDYSGPVAASPDGSLTEEGLCLVDHANNPGHPVKWHVRDDGWIGPSLSRDADVLVEPGKTLTVRYMLLVHAGGTNANLTEQVAGEFDRRPLLKVQKGSKPHHQWEIVEA